ncbi:MAG: hypothetical protein KKE83_10215 [Proteobacteria bacterium]|nr:hypothetical protein [Pseudomonadota bacterium]MBU1547836.1 hypothetical protein [Pseudomonadota bacterium]MBU2620046.1 hypothetical protein [Pseudomonadota bacterium]
MSDCPLDPETLALISLAANIAANHPKKGLSQLERLRGYGVSEHKIAMVIDIARHLRDEAGQMLDHEFDVAAGPGGAPVSLATVSLGSSACGCSPTPKGNACC